jgi:hypothetical protein
MSQTFVEEGTGSIPPKNGLENYLRPDVSNPSYSGGRDQEDHGSKPAWANSSQYPILKKPLTKKGLVDWLKM